MHNINNWFAVGLALLTLVALVAGVYQVRTTDPDTSLSALILTCAKRYPVLPLMVGMLISHIFWSQNGR